LPIENSIRSNIPFKSTHLDLADIVDFLVSVISRVTWSFLRRQEPRILGLLYDEFLIYNSDLFFLLQKFTTNAFFTATFNNCVTSPAITIWFTAASAFSVSSLQKSLELYFINLEAALKDLSKRKIVCNGDLKKRFDTEMIVIVCFV
jgi:hypothetical protein